MLVASLLLAIPFVGYFYIDGMESLLRKGQEQNLMGNARGLATALHERPNLFNKHASYKKELEDGKDFFPTLISTAIALDGKIDDWKPYITEQNTNTYNAQNQVKKHQQTDFKVIHKSLISLNYTTHIGRYKEYVYAFFSVTDNQKVFRSKNSLSVTNNDHLELATIDNNNHLVRYVFSAFKPGWTNAYLMPSENNKLIFPKPENRIQGTIRNTPKGYNIELRIPHNLVGEKFAFHITDHDNDPSITKAAVNIGTTSTEKIEDLGTFTVPSKQIERIIEASKRSHSSIRVIDLHQRQLLQKGSLINATGEWINEEMTQQKNTIFTRIKNLILEPFYALYLVKPAKTFITKDFIKRKDQPHIKKALQGKSASYWWKSTDNKAVILSAAHPIYLNGDVAGAVIVEETTHGIRNIRNKAVEGIIITSLLIALSVFSLFIYSLWTSLRIRRLRDQVESAVDEDGRIMRSVSPFNSNDEIGDVSRSMANIIKQLGQYNNYLQTMSSRLSHELKTPISVVRSSLEMLEQKSNNQEQKQRYMKRAKEGINRLNSMLLSMSEATHLEQALTTTDCQKFNLAELVDGCIQGYKQVYPAHTFHLNITKNPTYIMGSDEHIAQLFDKLISNAVEFSDEKNPITIRLSAEDKQAILSVENVGTALPKGMSNRIFESMVSIRKNKTTTPHLGIGLYICRLIATFHRGVIFAENIDAKKSVRFTIKLPQITS